MTARVEVMPGPQAEFVLCEKRFPAYLGGIGSGKSAGLMIKAMRDHSKWGPEKPGMLTVYTLPVMSGADMMFLPKWTELYSEVHGYAWTWNKKDKFVYFPPWEAYMFVRSAGEADALRGPEFARMYMDEIASEAIGSQEELFRIGQGRIRQKGFGPNQISVGSTPKVRWKWIVQRWQEKVNPLTGRPLPDPDNYPMFHARTTDNYHLPRDYVESLVSEWSGTRWGEQELEGKFISVEGLAFELEPDVHYVYPPEGTEFVRTVYGMDPGGTSPTAIIEWKQDRQGRKWATAEFYKRDADAYDWVQWLADKNAMQVFVDQAISEKERMEWRRRYGVIFKSARMKTFISRLELWRTGLNHQNRPPKIFITPNCPNLWNELNTLYFEKRRNDEYETNEWASGCSDHAYDAGAYGLMELEHGVLGKPTPSVNLSLAGHRRWGHT